MILWIDEFGAPHVAAELTEDLEAAVEDGLANVYRFDIDSNTYQEFNGKWETVGDN